MNDMIFTKAIFVRGDLHSSYCFETEQDRNRWIKEDLPELEKKYGKLEMHQYDLDGLKVGEKCYVRGDGDEVFEIIELLNYSKDRYGFGLDAGWSEEVVKCSRIL